MKLIDLDAERKAKRKRKAQQKKLDSVSYKCRTTGSDGEYFKFSVRYQFKGKNWEFDLWAKTKREAELRVFSITKFPVEITQILDEIPNY